MYKMITCWRGSTILLELVMELPWAEKVLRIAGKLSRV